MKWIRTCDECGFQQEDVKPQRLTDAYQNRKCKNCKSSGLDFGANILEEEDDNIPEGKYHED